MNISGAEVTNISKHGFWVLLTDQELFVAFKAFPWFKGASVEEIINVEWPQLHHLLLAHSRYRPCCGVHSIP
ncbi:DUF2442 domain-containing protein [Nitrospira sp. BLG_1]|uniref:DUF2442 domain-containing protein n=1 Tax=Nitrospira sp. BLG_1 TaxID=3395883 RepID=UPI0039BC22EC